MPVKHVSTSWAVTGRLVRNEPDVVFGGFQAKSWCNALLITYVALLIHFLHSASSSPLTDLEYRIALGMSLLSLFFLLLAAIGLRSNRSFALVPLFTLQTTALFFFGLTWGHTTFVLIEQQDKSWPNARLMIMVLYELLLLGLHLFCMRLVYVVIKAFYKFEKTPIVKTPMRRCSIPSFLGELNEESNEDKIIFEKAPDAPKKLVVEATSFATPIPLRQQQQMGDKSNV